MKTVLFLLLAFVSLNLQAQQVDDYISTISAARKEVEANIERTPFQRPQQDVFKKYFSELNVFISDLKEYWKLNNRLNNYAANNGLASLCKDLFLDSETWNNLKRKCTKNSFFLCAEEIKYFNLYKDAFKAQLYEDLKKSFSKTKSCNE